MSVKKILLVGSSSKGALEYSYLKAAEQLSIETVLFDPGKTEQKYLKGGKIGRTVHLFLPVEQWIRKANRELILLTKKFEPDVLVLFTNTRVLPGTLACIKTMMPAVKVVWIWPDTPMNLEKHNLLNAPLVDLTATYSSATLPVYQQLAFKNIHWIPLAGDPFMHGVPASDQENFSCDISFIGTWRPERERVMAVLCKQFSQYKIEIHGRYWKRDCKNPEIRRSIKGEGLYESAMARLFNQSRINMNVIDDTNFPAANMRFFEIPTARGLQLTSPCPEMETIFRHREQVVYYTNESDAAEQVKWILEHPEEGARIRQQGNALVMQEHTYVHRLGTIITKLEQLTNKSN